MLCRLFFHLFIHTVFLLSSLLLLWFVSNVLLPEAINFGCRHPILVSLYLSQFFFFIAQYLYGSRYVDEVYYDFNAPLDAGEQLSACRTSELAASSEIEEKRPQFTQILCAEKLCESDLDLMVSAAIANTSVRCKQKRNIVWMVFVHSTRIVLHAPLWL